LRKKYWSLSLILTLVYLYIFIFYQIHIISFISDIFIYITLNKKHLLIIIEAYLLYYIINIIYENVQKDPRYTIRIDLYDKNCLTNVKILRYA
jgi:hypothetical protein